MDYVTALNLIKRSNLTGKIVRYNGYRILACNLANMWTITVNRFNTIITINETGIINASNGLMRVVNGR